MSLLAATGAGAVHPALPAMSAAQVLVCAFAMLTISPAAVALLPVQSSAAEL